MTLTIERGEKVRQVTSMTFVASEVDDLITALAQVRERMLPPSAMGNSRSGMPPRGPQ